MVEHFLQLACLFRQAPAIAPLDRRRASEQFIASRTAGGLATEYRTAAGVPSCGHGLKNRRLFWTR